jgi:hypothetical protein
MPNPGWAQVAGTVFLGFVGLWLAHNYRRQIRLKLAERQVDSYMRLWSLTAVATPELSAPLDRNARRQLYDEMVKWYFADANGVFLSAATRNMFVAVRSNLVRPVAEMQPPSLASELTCLSGEDAERRRGCVSIRQASLLRTQLKTDLAMHTGFDYFSALRPDDRAFPRNCGLSLWRRPWRPRLFLSPARKGPNPCVCGLCPSAQI